MQEKVKKRHVAPLRVVVDNSGGLGSTVTQKILRRNRAASRPLYLLGKGPARPPLPVQDPVNRGVAAPDPKSKGDGLGVGVGKVGFELHDGPCTISVQFAATENVPIRQATDVDRSGTFAAMSNRVKMLRLERNWTQEELAEKLGVTHTTVQRIENGKRKLNEETAVAFATVFRCHPGELFAPIYTDAMQDEAARLIGLLPEDERAPLLKMLRRAAGLPEPRKARKRQPSAG